MTKLVKDFKFMLALTTLITIVWSFRHKEISTEWAGKSMEWIFKGAVNNLTVIVSKLINF